MLKEIADSRVQAKFSIAAHHPLSDQLVLKMSCATTNPPYSSRQGSSFMRHCIPLLASANKRVYN